MNDYFLDTYRRLPVAFAKGDGCYLYDTEGKKYLDLGSGIAVNLLGHNHPALVKAVTEQAQKIMHASNYYQTDVSLAFAEKLVAACAGGGMKKVFLGNSGAEANEGACKIARKYSLIKYGEGRHTIVTLKGSFHGRTITTLAATGQEKFHKDFGPFTEGFNYIPGGDINALDKALDAKKTAALLIEAVQGESGIVPQSPEFMRAAAKMCSERDILLMFDEIQCGMGRTGIFLAFEQYADAEGKPIKADVVTLAKGLAGGLPIGAVLAGEKACDVLAPGDHGSTFGANPVAAAAGIAVLDELAKPGFLSEVKRKGEKLIAAVKTIPAVKEARGAGLMIGFDIEGESWPMLNKALEKGLLLMCSGTNTLRLLPPYIITDSEIERGIAVIKELLEA